MTNDDRFRLDRVPATEDDWRDAVDGVLKGRPFEKVLVNQTAGGLDIQPLYAPASTEPILPVDPHRAAYGWDIRQRHEATSPSACQAAVLDDLQHGVTSIELGTPATAWASMNSVTHWRACCSRSHLSCLRRTPTWTRPEPWWTSSMNAAMLSRAAAGSASTHRGLRAKLGSRLSSRSPPSLYRSPTRTRTSSHARSTRPGTSTRAPTKCRRSPGCSPPAWRCSSTRSRWPSGRAGCHHRLPGCRGCRSVPHDRPAACGPIPVGFGTRRLWSRHPPVASSAVTSPAMFSRRDAAVNMLRSTSAAFGAGVGGADSVTVLPFDGSDSTSLVGTPATSTTC